MNTTDTQCIIIEFPRRGIFAEAPVVEAPAPAPAPAVEAPAAPAEVVRFQVGHTYRTRSACDWDCIFSYTVVSRTAKFLTLDDGYQVRRVGVRVWDGRETASPEGRYSMSPLITADREEA